jgi:hypothetical protein
MEVRKETQKECQRRRGRVVDQFQKLLLWKKTTKKMRGLLILIHTTVYDIVKAVCFAYS